MKRTFRWPERKRRTPPLPHCRRLSSAFADGDVAPRAGRDAAMRAVSVGLALALTTTCVRPDPATDVAPQNLREARTTGRGSDRLLPSDFQLVPIRTVADAILRLRPEFLAPIASKTVAGSASLPSVYLDGVHAGGLDALASIPLDAVLEIRRLTSVAAKHQFGSYCPCEGGVILVRTRRDASP